VEAPVRQFGAAILLLTGILLAIPGRLDAETRTVSWSAVTTYTDGTPIETTKTVTYDIYWTQDAGLNSASLRTVASSIAPTSATFDPDVLGMPRGQTIYFTGDAVLNTGEKSALASAYAWSVPTVSPPPGPPTLSGLSISGPSSMNESGSGTYTATATWSDGSTTGVTPTWSVSPATYASINTSGVLTTLAVTANQTTTITANYTSGGVSRSATQSVTIVDIAPTLSSLSISGPSSVNEGAAGTYTATATWSDGSTTVVTPTWSENSTYASIGAGGMLTTTAVPANQTATVSASYTSSGVTRTATQSVTIVDIATTLSSLSISGPSSVNEGAAGTYTATATWSDGSTTGVMPVWSISPTTYASINISGVLTALAVTVNQTVSITASYTSGGVTRSATQAVMIVEASDFTLMVPQNVEVSGPVSTSPDKQFRLTWDPVTTRTDGTPVPDGSLSYDAYWTTDPALSAGNLQPLASSSSTPSVDFNPISAGMPRNQRVYLTTKAKNTGGEQSPLAPAVSWVANNPGPSAPKNAKINKK